MNKVMIAICFVALTLCGLNYADSPIPKVATTEPAAGLPNLSMNFIQTADSASLEPLKNAPGSYALILENTGPYITYFTSRPNQFRGLIPVKQFIKAWGIGPNNFAANPPNGVLIAARLNNDANTANTPLLLTASKPVYNANGDKMGYVVKPLYAQTLFLQPLQLGRVTLILGS